MYGLNDVAAELRAAPWMTRAISGQPLEGLADGVNKIFRAPYMPLAATPAPVLYTKTAGGKVIINTASINYETGEVYLSSAPFDTPYIDCSVTMLAESKLAAMARRGFSEMQVRWRRDLFLYDDSSQLVVSASPTAAVDPATGSATFSTSEVQRALLFRCAEYHVLKALVEDANINAMSYREERMGGLLIDNTRRAKDFQSYLATCVQELQRTEDAARLECGEFGDFGVFLPGPVLTESGWSDATV